MAPCCSRRRPPSSCSACPSEYCLITAFFTGSPAAEQFFSLPVGVLLNHGLFDRVHVADRPAYLTALGDAAALGESRSVEFRVRREGADVDGRPSAQFVWTEL